MNRRQLILGASVLQDQHVDYSWELLARAPGVQVTQFKQGTDAGRFSMRVPMTRSMM